jgi:hypothetical protein
MQMKNVWRILKRFKHICKARGWRISENEDWVRAGEEYDNFLWTRTVSLPCFKSIISRRKCVVCEGLSYNVVEPSHTAWLFSERPSEDLVRTVSEDAEYSERVAIFDLSSLSRGKHLCLKLNNTRSPILQEFENFLRDELKVSVKTFEFFDDVTVRTDNQVVAEFS